MNISADPGQFSLPSFVVCHVVHSAQLFKKCWISTMAFTGALSTFVWSNLGWMRWLPVQGGLGSVQLRNGRLPLACPCLRAQSDTAGEFYTPFFCRLICASPFKHTGKVLEERLCDGECLSGKLQLWAGVTFVRGGWRRVGDGGGCVSFALRSRGLRW